MPQGKATNDLASASTKNAKTDKLGKVIILGCSWELKSDDEAKMNINSKSIKLLDRAAIELLKVNGYRPKSKIETTVTFSIKEYGTLCGKEVIPKTTSIHDKKIAKNSLDNFRKSVKESLDILYRISLSWTEPSPIYLSEESKKKKKSKQNFIDVRILQKKGIKNGMVLMQFTDDFASYILNAYVMPYPVQLFKADGRNPNTYAIGRKLSLIHAMKKNKISGRSDVIRVDKLVASAPGIDSYENIQLHDPGHWKGRMCNPLERALNDNVLIGVISRWTYCGPRKKKLSPEEITNMCSNYKSWLQLYIFFEI